MKLPKMKCDKNCGACCGPVLCDETEFMAVNKYAFDNGIVPKRQGLNCPWYQDGECKVYPVRPFACRLFGHVKKMVCCRGYNVNITGKQEKRVLREHKVNNPVLLHKVFEVESK